MEELNRDFQIFVKPVGAACNLRCTYCYYTGKKSMYKDGTGYVMDDQILETYITQHLQAATGEKVFFSWHGGEPLLAGLDFYRKAVSLQEKHCPADKKVINGIQTNGTLLNEQWCRFLAREKFVVGISIDGPAMIHDKHRKTINNLSTHHRVIKGFNLLKKYGVIPEVLCVVTSDNVDFPHAVYEFIRQLGVRYITFLPLVEQRTGFPGEVSNESVAAEKFGYFLSSVFDEWVERDIGEIKIQIVEEAVRTAFDQEHTLCIFRKECGGVPVVEHTGDFFSCDHFVDPGHLLGNINDHSLAYYLDSELQKSFGRAKYLGLPVYCLNCEVISMCYGECPKNRFLISPDGEPGLNYLCAGYKYFFNHCRPFIDAVGKAWKEQNNPIPE